jgi:predicted acylesterase/phospholipase RssA
MGGTIGIVLSGGGARGAYEFGALEELAPALDESARIVVGTSARGTGGGVSGRERA